MYQPPWNWTFNFLICCVTFWWDFKIIYFAIFTMWKFRFFDTPPSHLFKPSPLPSFHLSIFLNSFVPSTSYLPPFFHSFILYFFLFFFPVDGILDIESVKMSCKRQREEVAALASEEAGRKRKEMKRARVMMPQGGNTPTCTVLYVIIIHINLYRTLCLPFFLPLLSCLLFFSLLSYNFS